MQGEAVRGSRLAREGEQWGHADSTWGSMLGEGEMEGSQRDDLRQGAVLITAVITGAGRGWG